MKQIKRNQKGFTLVEIAIVLVIIGLLLGGVLKGQEMVEGARIKSVVNDLNGVSASYNTYIDRYRSLPGDDTAATLTGRGWVGAIAGNGNGVLNLPIANTFTSAGEQPAFWSQLRAANIAAGDSTATGAAALPRAGTGGIIGVTLGAYAITSGPTVCISNLTTAQAAGVDTTLDGKLPANNTGNNVGNARGARGAAPLAPVAAIPAASVYNDTAATTPWTLCRQI
ncbi:MAG: prepilin-type N-terminal cleavage/methylation domain-containing protein [Herminiimonas sp.]|uniref:prepilin-type N-terminal cleavage/methylation domain-containing protein n=1 Tax=Herminiimonas sp. TaxID=1926289 RepID=UPI00272570A9|nr:prepilin-type N-terminal cleavage/methylation domain-containing protein [Herminiimonas sp.]MDO9421468.1 prepilin-type N-terminal cleavage/methylation domain-containing protein [Herminiimonas sp.]